MKRALTDVFLRTLRAPSAGRLEVADAACRGLSLRVTPNDVRTWNFRFTNEQGSVARAALGNYPAIALAEARLRADALRRDIANGVDPVAAQRQRKAEARSGSKTFGHLAERYLVEHARRHNREKTVNENERMLAKNILPYWVDRQYAQITRADIVELIERVARKAPIMANRLSSLISKIFTFAIDVGLMSSSPAIRLKKPAKEKVKTRVLTDEELRLFWPRIIESPVSRPVGLALRLALLLGMRTAEVAGLRRDELRDFDDKKRAAIELKGERTKNGKPHRLPLSPLAHDAIAESLRLSDDDVFVFPSFLEGASVDPPALTKAMYRFADSLKLNSWQNNPPTPHDLRRTLRTRLSGLGTPREVCDAIMNHTPQDVGRKHYDLHDYAEEKREALSAWSRTLQIILDGKPGNVISLRKRVRRVA
jgi:integrase